MFTGVRDSRGASTKTAPAGRAGNPIKKEVIADKAIIFLLRVARDFTPRYFSRRSRTHMDKVWKGYQECG